MSTTRPKTISDVCGAIPLESDSDSLVYYAPVEKGGLFDYAIEQIIALHEQGQEVVCVGSIELKPVLESRNCNIDFVGLPPKRSFKSKVGRLVAAIRSYRANVLTLVDVVKKLQSKRVLFTSFAEYFAPFWANPLNKLQRKGTSFGVVVHDPVRDFMLGPRWWHEMSIRRAYSFVDIAFLHEERRINTYGRHTLRTCVIPHRPVSYTHLTLPTKRIV